MNATAERRFQCPCCWGRISMVLDLSVEAPQSYVEDCERCCAPLEIRYRAEDGVVVDFEVSPAGV